MAKSIVIEIYITLFESVRDVVIGRAYLYNTVDFSGWFKQCLGLTGNNLTENNNSLDRK